MTSAKLASEIADVLQRLRDFYGPPQPDSPGDGVDCLVATILSQNTSRANSTAGFRRLKKAFSDWDEVADARLEQIEQSIQVSGLAKIKAPRIRKILRTLRSRLGKIDLQFLAEMPDDQARDYLLAFDGIGPKTACCILLFAFAKDIFPVDTHIHRIAIRLGWIDPKDSAEKTHDLLAPDIAPGDSYDLHVLLIQHGRQTCKARSPRCRLCPLRQLCPSAEDFLGSG
jgi:endonuclease-3